jgi:hypothetical protein
MNDPNRFDPASVGTFRVDRRSFEPASRTLSLHYSFDHGPEFEETIVFESPAGAGPALRAPGFDRALLHLHVAAGTSYYKVAAPPEVVVEGEGLIPVELDFHQHLYDDGLREFALANGLPVPVPVTVRPGSTRTRLDPPAPVSRPGGLLVPIGGGKDSLVLIEAVRELRPRLFAVNPHPLVIELARQTGLDLLVVRRRLSSNLAELNRVGALNGHVPITAIVSLIAVVGSFLYGYDTIAMAVERSASEETVVVDGVPVNHQYSKSFEFEQRLRGLVAASVDPALTYGSALRPYAELAIGRAFARQTRYHSTFCSCNTVYRQSAATTDGWCGACPKCRFVALVLAPFLDPGAVASIIGTDLFDDPAQVDGFAALMSDEDKPFECVGERRESAAALRILSHLPKWRDKVVVAALTDRARGLVSDGDVRELLTPAHGLAFADGTVAAAVDRLLTELL